MALDISKLKHTICFCIHKDKVLMVHRVKSPNLGKWNGVGGKIETGETPTQGIYREAMEETGIDLNKAKVEFHGIVTWLHDPEIGIDGGMYTFIAYLDDQYFEGVKETREGDLEFKLLNWVCNKENQEVVKNITIFLPSMLKNKKLYEYRCLYDEEVLLKLTKIPIDSNQVSI